MKVFSVTTGITKIEFSVWKIDNIYYGKINGKTIYQGTDYMEVSDVINDSLESNVPYVGQTH